MSNTLTDAEIAAAVSDIYLSDFGGKGTQAYDIAIVRAALDALAKKKQPTTSGSDGTAAANAGGLPSATNPYARKIYTPQFALAVHAALAEIGSDMDLHDAAQMLWTRTDASMDRDTLVQALRCGPADRAAATSGSDDSAYQRGYLDGVAKGRRDASEDRVEASGIDGRLHALEQANKQVAQAQQRRAERAAKYATSGSELAGGPKQGDAHRIMLAAGFLCEYDKSTGVHTYTGNIEDAERVLAKQAGALADCGTYECKAGQRDGVICADGECDIASGQRAAPAPAAEEVRLESVAVQLDAKSAEAETWRENENNEFRERIWLGAREAYTDAARIVRAAMSASQGETGEQP